MHKKPKATRPNAKIDAYFGSSMIPPKPSRLTKKAPAISDMMSMPFQKALKLPATSPERMVRDAPPSREAVTISCTCLECELVKILVNSGMRTTARVPQLIIVASCHQSWGRALVVPAAVTDRSLMSSQLMPNDVVMHRMEAIQMRRVSGCSKSNSFNPLYLFSEIAWLMKYEAPDMKSIRKRIAKIQTISLACRSR